jgi:hypothetical protein
MQDRENTTVTAPRCPRITLRPTAGAAQSAPPVPRRVPAPLRAPLRSVAHAASAPCATVPSRWRCIRHRPAAIAGPLQGRPLRHRAPQRGAAFAASSAVCQGSAPGAQGSLRGIVVSLCKGSPGCRDGSCDDRLAAGDVDMLHCNNLPTAVPHPQKGQCGALIGLHQPRCQRDNMTWCQVTQSEMAYYEIKALIGHPQASCNAGGFDAAVRMALPKILIPKQFVLRVGSKFHRHRVLRHPSDVPASFPSCCSPGWCLRHPLLQTARRHRQPSPAGPPRRAITRLTTPTAGFTTSNISSCCGNTHRVRFWLTNISMFTAAISEARSRRIYR